MDFLILNSESIESLVGTETHEDLLELRLELLVSDRLDSELLDFVFHLFICNFIYQSIDCLMVVLILFVRIIWNFLYLVRLIFWYHNSI